MFAFGDSRELTLKQLFRRYSVVMVKKNGFNGFELTREINRRILPADVDDGYYRIIDRVLTEDIFKSKLDFACKIEFIEAIVLRLREIELERDKLFSDLNYTTWSFVDSSGYRWLLFKMLAFVLDNQKNGVAFFVERICDDMPKDVVVRYGESLVEKRVFDVAMVEQLRPLLIRARWSFFRPCVKKYLTNCAWDDWDHALSAVYGDFSSNKVLIGKFLGNCDNAEVGRIIALIGDKKDIDSIIGFYEINGDACKTRDCWWNLVRAVLMNAPTQGIPGRLIINTNPNPPPRLFHNLKLITEGRGCLANNQ